MTPAPLAALARWNWLALAVIVAALVANAVLMRIGGWR